MGFADLHIHSIYSYDGTATVAGVLQRAKEVGLDVIAITDHDEIRGSLKAFDLAPKYGLEAIPGIEITTAEGDLLALFVTEKIKPGLSLLETIMTVGQTGGICIVPHPMARGMGMKSLTESAIRQALQHPEASRILLGIETYNACALDRESNAHAQALAEEFPGVARLGNSDAHILQSIGLGTTEYLGETAADLLKSLWIGATRVHRGVRWGSARILGTWAIKYVLSTPTRVTIV